MYVQRCRWSHSVLCLLRGRNISFALQHVPPKNFYRLCCTPAARERKQNILAQMSGQNTRRIIELKGKGVQSNRNVQGEEQIGDHSRSLSGHSVTMAVIVTIAGAVLATVFSHSVYAEAALLYPLEGDADNQLPRTFGLSEISQHGPHSSTLYVLHGNRVYDITDFLPSHPGGEIILRACGGSVDAY